MYYAMRVLRLSEPADPRLRSEFGRTPRVSWVAPGARRRRRPQTKEPDDGVQQEMGSPLTSR